jgi:predicted ATPase
LIASQLSNRKALLCFDNCEHLLDSVAELVVTLQVGCPEISVLTTSREPLDVAGEVVWRVPSLTPSEAVSLFAERAGPGFTPDEEAEQAIKTICARLDGIPLAVELATAWLRTLTPQQIEAGLDDRFGLLVRSTRGVAARQQTLASSIDWSYDLLDTEERDVFRSLAVFAGGFTLEAAAAVYGPIGHREVIGRLVDKSLVVATDARYRLIETIREYAAARLEGELDGLRDRHLDYFLRVAEDAAPELDKNRDAWRAVIEPERENFRAALDHGLSGPDPTKGRRLAAALPWLWNLQGTGQEGIGYLRWAIECSPDDRSLLQARLLYGYATVADTAAPSGTTLRSRVWRSRASWVMTTCGFGASRWLRSAITTSTSRLPGIAARKVDCWRSRSATTWPGMPTSACSVCCLCCGIGTTRRVRCWKACRNG